LKQRGAHSTWLSGWTVFERLYILDGTIYIVTSKPDTVPELKMMISNGLPLELESENKPTSKTIMVITPQEAILLFGMSAGLLDGVSVSEY
jgi:hypothetical protein